MRVEWNFVGIYIYIYSSLSTFSFRMSFRANVKNEIAESQKNIKFFPKEIHTSMVYAGAVYVSSQYPHIEFL